MFEMPERSSPGISAPVSSEAISMVPLDARPTISSLRHILLNGTSTSAAFEAAYSAANAARSSGAFISLADRIPTVLGEGSLVGVPFAAKDNIGTIDLPTTGGTNALRGCTPSSDAPVIATLKAAGALLVGKTNLHELAFGVTNNNYAFGAAHNPYAHEYSPGGSSGGSALAVALGVVPFALGTDTGGSIRIPAAHCGVVGFRPTTGRWGAAGTLPLSRTRDTLGVIANTVIDVRKIDAVVTGVGSLADSRAGIQNIRLGVPLAGFYDDLDRQVVIRMAWALNVLDAAGAILVEVDLRRTQELDSACGLPLVLHETGVELPAYLRTLPLPYGGMSIVDIADGVASPDVRTIMTSVRKMHLPASDYQRCLSLRGELVAVNSRVFTRHQLTAIVYPTVPLVPPRLGEDATVRHNGRDVEVFAASTRNTGPGSLAGTPSISLPIAPRDVFPPVGICIEGSAYEDVRLLRLASIIESLVS